MVAAWLVARSGGLGLLGVKSHAFGADLVVAGEAVVATNPI